MQAMIGRRIATTENGEKDFQPNTNQTRIMVSYAGHPVCTILSNIQAVIDGCLVDSLWLTDSGLYSGVTGQFSTTTTY